MVAFVIVCVQQRYERYSERCGYSGRVQYVTPEGLTFTLALYYVICVCDVVSRPAVRYGTR